MSSHEGKDVPPWVAGSIVHGNGCADKAVGVGRRNRLRNGHAVKRCDEARDGLHGSVG